ncbi:SPOR domain-containing protein [uncultured Tenacibaculum sp.]|uniref:SPOR domain-containing protein n=1 Tax=uncultured Tenacibaculum sp. TaxID=174713 RepID=UPI00262B9A44|nr:SPOR domain-containing protein [uncultured Tenacibaculum sp.]
MIKGKNLAFILFLFLGFCMSYAQSNYTSDQNINSLLAKKRKYNKKNGSGYRIQLYNGTEQRAKNVRQNFILKFSEYGKPKMSYELPEWKVRVGRFNTKLEADRALNKIKEKFSGAIVIPY